MIYGVKKRKKTEYDSVMIILITFNMEAKWDNYEYLPLY